MARAAAPPFGLIVKAVTARRNTGRDAAHEWSGI